MVCNNSRWKNQCINRRSLSSRRLNIRRLITIQPQPRSEKQSYIIAAYFCGLLYCQHIHPYPPAFVRQRNTRCLISGEINQSHPCRRNIADINRPHTTTPATTRRTVLRCLYIPDFKLITHYIYKLRVSPINHLYRGLIILLSNNHFNVQDKQIQK